MARIVGLATIVSAVLSLLMFPDLRCSVRLHMPPGGCRDTENSATREVRPSGPRVDTVVIKAYYLSVPQPAPDPVQLKPGVPSTVTLPVQMTRLLIEADLEGKSQTELDIMRNEIYARHGREFDRNDLRRYFGQFAWYRPVYSAQDFDNHHQDLLTAVQRSNAEFILRYQHSRH